VKNKIQLNGLQKFYVSGKKVSCQKIVRIKRSSIKLANLEQIGIAGI